MSLRERLVDVGRFVMRPTYVARPMAWRPGFASALALMIGLNLLLVTMMRLLIEAALGTSGALPAIADKALPNPRDVLEYVLIAPLLEEVLFRGWMTGRKADLRFAVYGAAALALLLMALAAPQDFARASSLVAVALVFAGLIHWGLTRHRLSAVSDGFIRKFRWMVWGSSLVFGLIHLGRFEPLTSPLGALVVAPLMLGGLLLAYTRTRLGLRAAVLQHAAYNAVLVGLALALM